MSANAINPATLTAADFDGLLERLSGQIPEHCILTRTEDTRPYECDGLALYRALPPVVILPEDESQIIAVVQLRGGEIAGFVAKNLNLVGLKPHTDVFKLFG